MTNAGRPAMLSGGAAPREPTEHVVMLALVIALLASLNAAPAEPYSASMALPDGRLFFFHGQTVDIVDRTVGTISKGHALTTVVTGWPGHVPGQIDAADFMSNGKVYLFFLHEYARAKIDGDHFTVEYVKPISGNWPGLDHDFRANIDSVVGLPNGKTYFFKGERYVRYDMGNDHQDPRYPKPIKGNWKGVPWIDGFWMSHYGWDNQEYFFHGSEYFTFDVPDDAASQGPDDTVSGYGVDGSLLLAEPYQLNTTPDCTSSNISTLAGDHAKALTYARTARSKWNVDTAIRDAALLAFFGGNPASTPGMATGVGIVIDKLPQSMLGRQPYQCVTTASIPRLQAAMDAAWTAGHKAPTICTAGAVAFVMPVGEIPARPIEYVRTIYLCPLYWSQPDIVRAETLIHEHAHEFAPQAEGEEYYFHAIGGGTAVKPSWDKSLNNADSYGWTVMAMNGVAVVKGVIP